ncbi:hypothetical protein ACJX0J_026165, partial [Zea mays]
MTLSQHEYQMAKLPIIFVHSTQPFKKNPILALGHTCTTVDRKHRQIALHAYFYIQNQANMTKQRQKKKYLSGAYEATWEVLATERWSGKILFTYHIKFYAIATLTYK